ncbi:MAG: TVP38/TMEM64 family protein [Deltaproteobacteria bacterium]|nr:TVP38/TMEM64 family protein [Deltaproteobacteria bacterium]
MKKLVIGIVVAVALAVGGVLIARSPAVAGAIAAAAEWARGAGAIGVIGFVVVYVIATLVLLPVSVLTIAAGFTYGLGWGIALVIPTAIVSASLAFFVGRTLARRAIERRFGGDRRFKAIDAAVEKRGAFVVALLRLSPVFPFVALNYVLSITKVKARTYVAASALGMLPATILYVYLGSLASTAAEAARGGSGTSGTRLALLVAGLVATAVVVVVIAKLARRELSRTGAASSERS